jgi:hypothetical protein
MTSLIKATCLLLHIIERWYVYCVYDLRNFSHEYRSRTLEQRVIHVAETFTITKKSTALLVDDEKVYPPFCYKNYAEYAVMKAAQPIGTYPTAEMLTFLKRVKEADVEKYYRTID